MKCKNCNAENSDGANFCNICGAKLDEEFICAKCGAVLKSDDVFCSRCGERIESESENGSDIQNSTRNGISEPKITKCKNCNAENSDGAKFCNICGAKLDEEFICAKCGAVLKADDVFCSRCGERIESESENGSDIHNSTRNGFCKGMNVAALAMSVCLAVITVIFAIFMGCKGGEIISLPQGESQEINLFYYFGNAWKELNNLPELADTYKTSVYLRIILGLLIYAATLFTVLVLSIMSVVRNLNVLTKQGDKSGIKLSLMSFFVFVAGAMGLFFIHSVSIGLDLPYNSEIPKKILNALKELTTKLNGATIAGFAVGGVFLALMAIFALLSNEKKRFNAFNILNFFLSLVGIAFLTVFAAMFLKPFTTSLFHRDSI